VERLDESGGGLSGLTFDFAESRKVGGIGDNRSARDQ